MPHARALELDDAARARFVDGAATVVESSAADGMPSPHDEARRVTLLAEALFAGSAVEQACPLDALRTAHLDLKVPRLESETLLETQRRGRAPGHNNVNTGSVDRCRSTMDEAFRARFECVLGPRMRSLGHAPDPG